jgi:hypothetical protein
MDSQKIESAPDETGEEREGHDRRGLPEASGLVKPAAFGVCAPHTLRPADLAILAVEGHTRRLIPGPTLFAPRSWSIVTVGHVLVNGLVRVWIDVLVPSIYTGNRHTDGKLLRSTTGDHRASRRRR